MSDHKGPTYKTNMSLQVGTFRSDIGLVLLLSLSKAACEMHRP
jgi:hypothetical protein